MDALLAQMGGGEEPPAPTAASATPASAAAAAVRADAAHVTESRFGTAAEMAAPGAIWNARAHVPSAALAARASAAAAAGRVPAPQGWREQARQLAARQLMTQLQSGALAAGATSLPNTAFEMWQFGAKMSEGSGAGDPLLPGNAEAVDRGALAAANDALLAALQAAGVRGTAQRAELLSQLLADSLRAARHIAGLAGASGRAGTGASAMRARVRERVLAGGAGAGGGAAGAGGGGGGGAGGSGGAAASHEVVLGKKGAARLPVHGAHLRKLLALYRRWNPPRPGSGGGAGGGAGAGASVGASAEEAEALFCLLARHEGLQGGGFQAACNEEVFGVLLRRFGVRFECFASPLNCHFSSYCSAFADTDVPFGSAGSFFAFDPSAQGGSFEANPPFVPELVLAMAQRIDELLAKAGEGPALARPLSFAVVIPTWRQTQGWQRLLASPFMQRHEVLRQRDHGYCEGKQWMRKSRWRVASFDTSVFFLQNAQGAARWPATDDACRELRAAFASKQSDAPDARRDTACEARRDAGRVAKANTGAAQQPVADETAKKKQKQKRPLPAPGAGVDDGAAPQAKKLKKKIKKHARE